MSAADGGGEMSFFYKCFLILVRLPLGSLLLSGFLPQMNIYGFQGITPGSTILSPCLYIAE